MLLHKKQTTPPQNKQTKKPQPNPSNSNSPTQKHLRSKLFLPHPPNPLLVFFFYVAIKTNAYNLLNKYEAAGIQDTEHSENTSSIRSTIDNCKNKISLF